MSLDSPTTYAEWYWKHNVDASKAFDESLEQALAPSLAGVINDIPEISELPPGTQNLVHMLGEPPSAGLGTFILAAGAEFTAELLKEALRPSLNMMTRAINRKSLETWLTPQEAVVLSHRKKIDDDFFYLLTSSAGYDRIMADFIHTAQDPFPAFPDIIRWGRYQGLPDNPQPKVLERFQIDHRDWDIWEWLSRQLFTTENIQQLFVRDDLAKPTALHLLAELGWPEGHREPMLNLGYSIPNGMLLAQAGLAEYKPPENILTDLQHAGIHPDYTQAYLNAILTKPAPEDILRAMLRVDPDMLDADRQLYRIGIHPDFMHVYKTLMKQIPPVGDIITMAVREAFTPEIAIRFGQYEDFPDDLRKYASMQGLTEEWAKRYWAAHWALPSPQQGFEMLHRGVIEVGDLELLLRASDVMPFWRDKLVKIAYRPLTRVDVRRMYGLGVLDEREVYEAYLNLGYDETNAERMAEFTIKQVLETQSRFNAADVVNAFNNRIIERADAISILVSIGIPSNNASQIIERAEYTRLWDWTQDRIRGIKNLYKQHVLNANQTQDSLGALNLPATEITNLMDTWYKEVKEEPVKNWTRPETLSFLKKEIITEARAKTELVRLGYDDEHINAYFKALTWKEEKESKTE